jgi:hypothetical protein
MPAAASAPVALATLCASQPGRMLPPDYRDTVLDALYPVLKARATALGLL